MWNIFFYYNVFNRGKHPKKNTNCKNMRNEEAGSAKGGEKNIFQR